MKQIILNLLVAITISSQLHSQKIIISGEETNRKLKWSDFTGKPDDKDPYFAYTNFNIRPVIDKIMFRGDTVLVGKLEVNLELDPLKSWVKMDHVTDALLVHEQGHFDIGILCMRESLILLAQVKFTKTNFGSLPQQIVSDMLKKYSEMTERYDAETNHSANKDQQKKWNKFFEDELKK
jgi:hypothetical protein